MLLPVMCPALSRVASMVGTNPLGRGEVIPCPCCLWCLRPWLQSGKTALGLMRTAWEWCPGPSAPAGGRMVPPLVTALLSPVARL